MNGSREDEYAEAFRRGYERARRGFEPTVRLDLSEGLAPDVPAQRGADQRDDGIAAQDAWLFGFAGVEEEPAPPSSAPVRAATPAPAVSGPSRPSRPAVPTDPIDADRAREAGTDRSADPNRSGEDRRRQVLLLAGLGLGAVLLVSGAFGLGRLVADAGAGSAAAPEESAAAPATEEGAYAGPVTSVDVSEARATCQAPASVDGAGNPISYGPALAVDGDLTTAWRCAGTGAGQRLTLVLPAGTAVAEVGLVPGYAKTDPVDGTDRYAQNNRITRVRWTFDDGTSVVQRMSGDARDRSLRTLRVPVTRTGRVVVEILRAVRGPRNTVAISELRVAGPRA